MRRQQRVRGQRRKVSNHARRCSIAQLAHNDLTPAAATTSTIMTTHMASPTRARIQDTMNCPSTALCRTDPASSTTSWHFHSGELLEIRPGSEERFTTLGFDLGRLQRGIDHLRTSLRLDTSRRALPSRRGALAAALRYQRRCDLLVTGARQARSATSRAWPTDD